MTFVWDLVSEAPNDYIFVNEDILGEFVQGGTTSGTYSALSTIKSTTGKWYWEVVDQTSFDRYEYETGETLVGLSNTTDPGTNFNSSIFWGVDISSERLVKCENGVDTLPGVVVTGADNTTIQFAVDLSLGYAWVGRNGVWLNSGDPVAGINPSFTGITEMSPIVTSRSYNYLDVLTKIDSTLWIYSEPTGFISLNDTISTDNVGDVTPPLSSVIGIADIIEGLFGVGGIEAPLPSFFGFLAIEEKATVNINAPAPIVRGAQLEEEFWYGYVIPKKASVYGRERPLLILGDGDVKTKAPTLVSKVFLTGLASVSFYSRSTLKGDFGSIGDVKSEKSFIMGAGTVDLIGNATLIPKVITIKAEEGAKGYLVAHKSIVQGSASNTNVSIEIEGVGDIEVSIKLSGQAILQLDGFGSLKIKTPTISALTELIELENLAYGNFIFKTPNLNGVIYEENLSICNIVPITSKIIAKSLIDLKSDIIQYDRICRFREK